MTLVTTPDPEPQFGGNHYEVLCVDRKATQEQIKSSYRLLVRKFHPDHNPDCPVEKFQQIQVAYDVLSDPTKRQFYDNTGIDPLSSMEVESKGVKVAENQLIDVCNTLCGDGNNIDINQLKRLNPVVIAEDRLKVDLRNVLLAKENAEKVKARLEVVIARFKKKQPRFDSSFVGLTLIGQLDRVKRSFGEISHNKLIVEHALKVIRTVEYQPDVEVPVPTSTVMSTNVNPFAGFSSFRC